MKYTKRLIGPIKHAPPWALGFLGLSKQDQLMRNYLIYINKLAVLMLFISLPSVADDLPDELLNAPIHLISGKSVSLAEYKGERPVYLKFWATWCQPCREQMPHFEHVQKKYGDEVEV